jgi:hypothetical protein
MSTSLHCRINQFGIVELNNLTLVCQLLEKFSWASYFIISTMFTDQHQKFANYIITQHKVNHCYYYNYV